MFLVGAIRINKRGYIVLSLFLITLIYFHLNSSPAKVSEQEISLLSLLKTAVRAAEVGGEIVVSVKNDLKIHSKGKTNEGLDDSVTTADFLSHCAMKHIIQHTFPSVIFISEEKDTLCESGKDNKNMESNTFKISDELVRAGDVTFWIDPLDATHEYTETLYQYVTTMVCVAVKGQPIIGVVHNPFDKNTSWAVVGHGHSSDLKQVLQKNTHAKTKVIVSRSHSGTIKDILKKNFKNIAVETAAGAGYKALKVAKGDVDAYLHTTAIKKWDICAGNAILNALGGKMTTKHGETLTYYNDTDVVNKDGLIATLKHHEMFVDKL